ncbi:sulfurtransferase Alvin_2599-like [Hemitrygon akajei]|uniref:sulfurtransferase Alvin_2599-like n=1 Tax=Hemitrygon akajei TaxID=2704970 RepID=UPI003BF95AEB
MNPVIWWIRTSFRSVQDLESNDLQERLKPGRRQVLLLDVRSPAEYEVSHLEGAIRIDPETTDMEKVVKELGLADSQAERDVVCYCTVGYRSSKLVQGLGKFLARETGEGLGNSQRIYNLEGGLVKWANEGKPIVDSKEQPTQLVHPYSSVWAYLLEPQFRAPI